MVHLSSSRPFSGLAKCVHALLIAASLSSCCAFVIGRSVVVCHYTGLDERSEVNYRWARGRSFFLHGA